MNSQLENKMKTLNHHMMIYIGHMQNLNNIDEYIQEKKQKQTQLE